MMDEKIQELNELIKKLGEKCLQQKEIMSLEEAQAYLNVSKSFMYKLTSKGEITYFKPNGKLIYFKKQDLDKWMLQNENVGIGRVEEEINNYLKRRENGECK